MIPIEQFATLRAEMERGGTVDAVVEAAGLNAEEWTVAERHWQAAIARDLSMGGRQLADRYLAAFDAPAVPTQDPPKLVPTYLHASPGPGTPPAVTSGEAAFNPDATAMVDLEKAAAGQRLPFASSNAAQPPAPHDIDERRETGTVALDLGEGSQQSMPEVFTSVDRYAQLITLIAVTPKRSRALMIFGLKEDQWESLAQTWEARIRNDPSVKVAIDAELKRRRGG